MSFCLNNEDIKDSDKLGEKLLDLAGIVFRKHFYASYNEREDLISVGVLKALSLIDGGNFDDRKGTVLNFLYTGMRNEMHNYLYHRNKKVKGCETLSEITYDIYFEDECFKIDFKMVEEVCIDFSFYGDLRRDVVEEIIRRGFIVFNVDSNKFLNKLEKNVEYDLSCNKFKADLVDRLCGVILWKSREYSL